jgi:hypothetical protein
MSKVKFDFPHLLPGDKPITLVEEYLAARHPYDQLNLQIRAIQLKMKRLRDQGKTPASQLFDELNILRRQEDQVSLDFFRRLPYILISRCPYCDKAIWMKVGLFSLVHEFWYRVDSDGREEVPEAHRCPHLFCVDGALNLNGHSPTDAKAPITTTNKTISMAAEVPFVKPRVLNLPTMVAVIHNLPVADKYTAYPIVYFAQQQPPQDSYCIGWARIEYVDHHRASPPGVVIIGKRSDAQDYELAKWVQGRKLFWLDPTDEEHPLVRGPAGAFPYNKIPGRRNPYLIKDGQVSNLPNPTKDSKPKNRLEW